MLMKLSGDLFLQLENIVFLICCSEHLAILYFVLPVNKPSL